MPKLDKRLEGMRNNPRNDWKINDVETVCRVYDIRYNGPSKGSHAKISDPSQMEILTIPARRPIKPIYIRNLVRFVDKVLEARRSQAILDAVAKTLEIDDC